jgi:hypothetical protein
MWKIFAAAVFTIGLVGCETLRDHQMERSVARSRAAALAKIDPEECRAKGGAIQQVGMFGTPSCVTPLQDGGKACSSNSECSGVCFAPDGVPIGQAATGTCQVDTAAMFGCHDHVEGGVVVGGLCVD